MNKQPGKQESTSGKWFLKAGLVITSLLLTLVLLEGAVRLLDLPPRMLPSLNFAGYVLSENPILKYEYKPGLFPVSDAQFKDHRNFLINSEGFRDREFTIDHPPELIRIIMLGDSVTAGNGIPNPARVYPALLQQILNQEAGSPRFEVYNMAVGGYHTLQEVETLRVKGLKYTPNLVLIGFCINDFELDVDGGVYQKLRQQLGQTEQEVLPYLYQESRSWFFYLLSKSRLLFFLYYRTRSLLGSPVSDVEYQRDILKGKDPVTAGLELLTHLQTEHPFQIFLVIIPAFVGSFETYAYWPVHNRVAKICASWPQITLIDTLQDFRQVHENGNIFSSDGLHPNEYGHRILARVLARHLSIHLNRRSE